MKETKSVCWTTKTGKQIEVKIEITRGVEDNVAYADGYNINLGKKTVDRLHIEVYADGKYLTRDFNAPHILDPKFNSNYNKLVAAGAYARLGDVYINESQYGMIMAAIGQINADATPDAEFAAVKAQEDAKKAAQEEVDKAAASEYARALKNGLCPKCGTYCYGDCEAN